MAHHEDQPTAIESVLDLLSEHGLGAMADAMQTPLNEAMNLERSEFLRAGPGERSEERAGYANGFEDKTMCTRVGELALRYPQAWPLPGGEPLGFDPKPWSAGCVASER
jgi:transposase-like protein